MQKRILSLLLALVLIFGLFPAVARATAHDNETNNYIRKGSLDNGLYYEVYEDHVEIISYEGAVTEDATEVVIPNEIEGLPVTHISTPLFYGCTRLTKIVLPDSITYICEYAFDNCSSLTSIVIPDGVTSINEGLFDGCSSLTSIVIPNTVTFIGKYAFRDCSNLANIAIPDSVTFIGNNAFEKCQNLTSIVIPDGVTSIGDYTFSWCNNLTSVIIPDSVTSIGDYAFYANFSLSSAKIPDNVISIGDYAFNACISLPSIVIPDSVTSIGNWSFCGCESASSITISNSITTITNGAFDNCSSLTSIVIPDNVTTIDERAFSFCRGLSSIVIPDSVTTIGKLAFWWDTSLTSIIIPGSVTFIGDNAFMKCEKLSTVYFEGDAPEIGEYLFAYDTITAYYPADNPTWTEDVMQNFVGEDITWVAYDPNAPENPFTDVPSGCWYEAPVLWALENGITTGTSDTTFSPGDKCLRAHVVTFLWKAEQSPEPTAYTRSFTDVPANSWFYKPVHWAVENGITSGTSDTTFGAADVCTRYQVVYFLWAAAGKPEPETTENPFTDVKPSHFFYKAVLWAVENEITSGTSATTFGPTVPCNRAQVVTFLYAAYN